MKQFLLVELIPDDDVDFLNETSIVFDFLGSKNDSGWCDGSTGARIVSKNDKILFSQVTTDSELLLKLKFGDRITEFVEELRG